MDKNEDISRKRDVLAVNGPGWAFLVNEQDEIIPPETNESLNCPAIAVFSCPEGTPIFNSYRCITGYEGCIIAANQTANSTVNNTEVVNASV